MKLSSFRPDEQFSVRIHAPSRLQANISYDLGRETISHCPNTKPVIYPQSIGSPTEVLLRPVFATFFYFTFMWRWHRLHSVFAALTSLAETGGASPTIPYFFSIFCPSSSNITVYLFAL
jgi:hypothetical protein